jgi:hypothetical protein
MELVGILIGHMYFFLMFKVRSIIIEEGRGKCSRSSSFFKNLLQNMFSSIFSTSKLSPPLPL